MDEPALLLPLAGRLAHQAGLSDAVELERLAGGRNNRTFRVGLASGDSTVLKLYHRDIRDPRDRLGAEWAFIDYAWSRGIRRTPRALAVDHDSGAGLYSFIRGRKLRRDEIDRAKIDAALIFVKELNTPPAQIGDLSPASEACFTLNQHIATIDKRVARLAALDPEAPLRREAEILIGAHLHPLWTEIRGVLMAGCARLGLASDAPLAANEMCASPSDFGFHNALVDEDGGMIFIDFEYAGIDDPAKLIADFFCQPEIPIPFEYFERFAEGVLGTLGLGALHLERARLLVDAYRIKWLCIMLNDFLPIDAERRGFSALDSREVRCAERLAAAREAIDFLAAHREPLPPN